jgi:uncharacterized SAM-binding protein YcdF (DUF218 family)
MKNGFTKALGKKWFKALAGMLLFFLLLFLFRVQIFKGLGNYLIYENELDTAGVVFVLSGSPFDRGNEAAKVFKNGFANRIICTGELVPHNFKVLGLAYPECRLTAVQIVNSGIDSAHVTTIPKGTSTKEEAEVILAYCLDQNIKKCMVLSSKFHTRRIKKTFKSKFGNKGIEVIIHGAPSSQYEESKWWQSEYGLLAVNNEYVKLIYYLFH